MIFIGHCEADILIQKKYESKKRSKCTKERRKLNRVHSVKRLLLPDRYCQ